MGCTWAIFCGMQGALGVCMDHPLWASGGFGGGMDHPLWDTGGFRAVILETGNQRRAKTSILQVLGICSRLDDISFGKIKEMKRNT